MSYALGVVAFVVALLVSVMLHEAGHFVTAKAYGMKASRFFVGFGPTLWSFTRGETEYGIKAIPAGGFVKIEGMTALEEIEPADADRAFYKQPAGRRVVVLVAGSFVHLVLAVLLVGGVIAVTHQDPVESSVKVAALTGPDVAAAGHLLPGDVVVAIDGREVSDPNALGDAVASRAGQPVTITVERAGRRLTETVVPKATEVSGRSIGRIGIEEEVVGRHDGAGAVVPRTFDVLGDFISSTGSAIGGIPHEVKQIFTGQQRSDNSAASVVDIARVSGQIASSGASTSDIVSSLVLIVAELNLFVGLFNLLPLLPLDGGHVAIAVYEKGRSSIARWLGRRDPGPVDILKVLPLTYAVVAVFVGLSLVLLYAGIANPIKLQ